MAQETSTTGRSNMSAETTGIDSDIESDELEYEETIEGSATVAAKAAHA